MDNICQGIKVHNIRILLWTRENTYKEIMGKLELTQLMDDVTGLSSCALASHGMLRKYPVNQMLLLKLTRSNNYNLIEFHCKSEKIDLNWVDNMDRTAAHWAAADGSYEALLQLNKLGADVQRRDKFGMTPLLWAGWFGHAKCVLQLAKIYKDKVVGRNKKRMNLLHCAAANDQEHIVEFVGDCLEGFKMNARDINGWTALHMACDKGFTRIVEMLLKFNVKTEVVDKTGCLPMHYACRNGNMQIIKALIRAGSNVSHQDKKGFTPLHYAVTSNKLLVVKKLLKRLNAEELNRTSNIGETALVSAAVNGKREILALFLRHPSSNVNAQDKNGNTVYHLCCRRTTYNAAILTALLNTGKADVNITNERGDLPIHAAIEYNDSTIVSMLVQAGSSLLATTKYGNSPLILALKSGDKACVDAIIRGQRIHQLSGNNEYFKENLKPQLKEELALSDDSDIEIENPVKAGGSGNDNENKRKGDDDGDEKSNDEGQSDINEDSFVNGEDEKINSGENKNDNNNDKNGDNGETGDDKNDDDDGTGTIIGDSDEDLNVGSDDDDKEDLIKTTVDQGDKTSDILEDYRKHENGLKKAITDRRSSMSSRVSGGSSVSFNSIAEMKEVRHQLLKNLAYLKDHEKFASLGSFDDLEDQSDQISPKFQSDLNTVLKEMNDEDLWKEGNGDETKDIKNNNDDKTSIKNNSVSMYEGSIDGSIDFKIFDPYDRLSNTSKERLVVEEEEEDEALLRKMNMVLWKAAHKKMKNGEWIELAKHWQFPRSHIQAIQHFEAKSSRAYKESSYRLLSIWLDCFRQLQPSESPVKDVFEAFMAVGNKPLAEHTHKIRHFWTNEEEIYSIFLL